MKIENILILLILICLSTNGVFAMEITSTGFKNNNTIPAQYTCDGKNISPALSWKDAPHNTQSFVLIVDDPDAPVGIWDHWILFNIPPSTNHFSENIQQLPEGTKQGLNGWKKVGYQGPCPPFGSPHRYYFKLYALDQMLDLQDGATKKAIMEAMQSHIIAEAKLLGYYQR